MLQRNATHAASGIRGDRPGKTRESAPRMKAAAFEYARPRTIAEASAALARNGEATAAIAGGQSLLPMLSLRVALPGLLVDIGGLEELKETTETSDELRIGALTTHADIEDGKVSGRFGGLMQTVAAKISYRAIRNYGTIGGSVALADPAADWPGCLMALGAVVRISGLEGIRSEPVSDFIQGQYATSLARDEIVVGFNIPRPDAPLRWGFFKVVRKSGAFANSIAFAVAQGRGGPVSVVLGAAAARPHFLPAIAERLKSGETCEEAMRAAIARDLAAYVPDDDPYLTRLHTSTVLRAVRKMQTQ
jgi:carbon-monoxide dehydrogenase medium subunit